MPSDPEGDVERADMSSKGPWSIGTRLMLPVRVRHLINNRERLSVSAGDGKGLVSPKTLGSCFRTIPEQILTEDRKDHHGGLQPHHRTSRKATSSPISMSLLISFSRSPFDWVRYSPVAYVY
jgi:hypothetical protein